MLNKCPLAFALPPATAKNRKRIPWRILTLNLLPFPAVCCVYLWHPSIYRSSEKGESLLQHPSTSSPAEDDTPLLCASINVVI